ncbi:MAG: glycoside hydrolase family 3 C-terminal domain-containing protein [Bacteroidales bacterium]|nr:glycoside hydrolase family 3 C-terminal domain-containing protein [Bacteroidales bacterium]
MKKLLTVILALAAVACAPKPAGKFLQSDPRVEELMKQMTLEEKIGQMVLFTSDWSVTGPTMRQGYLDDIRAGRCGNLLNAYTADFTREVQRVAVEESRLGIPILFGYDVIHGFRTIFPINLGMSASWDIQAIEKSAQIAAEEAAAAGLQWTYSPMCDISVEPRWGRISEGSGEDPYLGSLIAAAMVRGYQGDDLSSDNTVLACVKHFAAYGAPQAGRDYNTVDMSERWLREFYLPPYKAAVDAGALSVMASFNELDGVPAHANKHLMQDILRDEWGFEGFIVTDYTGINEMVMHGYAANEADAGALSVNAGVDMDMMSASFMNYLKEKVEKGEVSEKTVDAACRRILNLKAALGLLDDPYKYCDPQREKDRTLTPENKAFARSFAAETMVLLKNNGILPLAKGEKVAVLGPLADSKDDLLGSWRGAGEVQSVPASVLDAIKEVTPVSAGANKVVLVIGEPWSWTGEAASRSSIRIPEDQVSILKQLKKQGRKVVVVLMNGRPLDLSEESELADAILEAWYPGTMGGYAVADVLFGDVNPCGKLSVTFPRNLGQVPIYHYAKNTGRPYIHPDAKYESRYLDVPNEPLYAFGHGLSYTTFEYSDITLEGGDSRSESGMTFRGEGTLKAKVTVTNTGDREGTEVVQMYIRDLVGSVTRPVRQLKGFERITLGPGESREVEFTICKETLSFYRQDMTWGPESGDFNIFIGGASDCTKNASFKYEI